MMTPQALEEDLRLRLGAKQRGESTGWGEWRSTQIVLEHDADPYIFEEDLFKRMGELSPAEAGQLERIQELTAKVREAFAIPEKHARR